MRALIYFGLTLLATVCQDIAVGQNRPNIVFILADDLGYGDLGVYGQTKIETPHIDRLAKNGLLFTDFYSGAPVCAPSRSALLTGQHTGHTYIRGNKEIQPEGQEPLAENVVTFAERLQQSGYQTGAFGKWGLGMVGTSGDPNRRGFDEFFGYNCQREAHRYYPNHLWHNDQRIELEGNNTADPQIYAPDLIQTRALAFIRAHSQEPFFLFVPTPLPHAELVVPEDSLFQKYKGRFDETPFKGSDYGPGAPIGYSSQEQPRATFAAMVARLDRHVGQLVETLEEEGILDNTIIIFTSDNGAHQEGGADPMYFQSSGNLRGYKRDLYEGGIRVPLIVHWPDRVDREQIVHHVAAFWDIGPTLLQLAQADSLPQSDGISFLPTLIGKAGQQTHPYLYWEFHEQGGRQAVRIGDYKAVRMNALRGPEAPVELYHLPTDIGEQRDIAEAHPELVQQAMEIMSAAREEHPLFPFWPTY